MYYINVIMCIVGTFVHKQF